MTDADKIMHPQHFGTDPTDIRIWIRIRINSKIRIRCRVTFVTNFGIVGGLRSLSAVVVVICLAERKR